MQTVEDVIEGINEGVAFVSGYPITSSFISPDYTHSSFITSPSWPIYNLQPIKYEPVFLNLHMPSGKQMSCANALFDIS